MKRKSKTRQKKKSKSELVIWYADIETFAPATDPQFWIGGIKDHKGDYRAYDKFVDFFDDLTSKIKGKRKVIVFHNSKYDLSIIQYHAHFMLGYQINPYRKAQTKAIYMGHYSEIYTDDNMSPTFVVDSKNLLPGALDKYGKQIGLLKGETPIVHDYRKPTQDDYDYLERDVDILETVFKKYGHETSLEHGYLTISSLAQSSVKEIYRTSKGQNMRHNAIRRRYGAKEEKQISKPLPTAVNNQIERDTEAFKERETVYAIKTRKRVYGVNKDVVERYRKYITRYWVALLNENVYKFKKRQNEAYKKINNKKYDEELVKGYFDIKCPKGTSPHGKHLADNYHMYRILENVNSNIAPAMRGGMTYINPNHVGKELSNGGVLDVNSLYPFILMSFGIPSEFAGYTDDLEPNRDKYFIAEIKSLKATVKDDLHPFLKRNTHFLPLEKVYEREIEWEYEVRKGRNVNALTSVDINWMYKCYDVHEITYGRVYYFEEDKDFTKAVRKHIRYWRKKKENATTVVDRQYAKFMLNTIWGRWGMFEKEVDDAGKKIDIGDKDTNYVSAIFTTSYARVYLNKMMNWFGNDLIYTDTDSVHFIFNEKVKDEKDLSQKLSDALDPNVFGKWDFEKKWTKAKYMKPKTYAMMIDDEIKTVTAGSALPKIESLDEFHFGAMFPVKENKKDKFGRELIYKHMYTLSA